MPAVKKSTTKRTTSKKSPAKKKLTPETVEKIFQVMESMFTELQDLIADYKAQKVPAKFPEKVVFSMLKKVSSYMDTSKMKPADLKTNIWAGLRVFMRLMGILNRASEDSKYASNMHEDLEGLLQYSKRLAKLAKQF